jgi:tetratricopeptide (TPR) repeat protein
MHPSLLTLLVGLLYILGFDILSYIRRQGISTRIAIEGLLITAVFAAIAYISPVNLLLFLIVLYLITMRVRILVDLASWLTSRKRYGQALDTYSLALRLGPDDAARTITLINRGVTQLKMGEPEAAFNTLDKAMSDQTIQLGSKYQSAGFYNLGLACRRTGREARAIRHFNEAINTLPASIYAHGARLALKEGKPDKENSHPSEE